MNFFQEYIAGDRIQAIAQAQYDVGRSPQDVQLLMRQPVVYVKTDFWERGLNALRQRSKPCVLITHNSDIAITEKIYKHKPPSVKVWFAVNVEYKADDLIPIPLGCENKRSPGYSGDMKVINQYANDRLPRPHLCFLNCNPRTWKEVREPLIEKFKEEPWVHYEPYGCPFDRTMELTRASKFVLCPRGNGIDTHRFWEAVYLGAIPVVETATPFCSWSESIPMLTVDCLQNVTKDMLEQTWKDIKSKQWSLDHAKFSYWRKRILRCLS